MEKETKSTEAQEAVGIWITVAMVSAQFLQVGLNTIIKAAISKGMSNFVFVVYSNAIAFCFLLPSTFFFHRNRSPPSMSLSIICRIFLSSLLGCCLQTCLYAGIGYSSPTLASALEDLTPSFTFILAIISRMERLDLKLQSCQAKSIGTVVCIIGALTVTLYKGLPLTSGSHLPNRDLNGTFLSTQSNWLLGGFLITVGIFCLSLLFIVQTWIVMDYPAELIITTISSLFVAILSTIVALVAEPDPKAWVLKPDMEIVAVLYSAIFLISFRNAVYTWACRKKGPVYVAMFNPLGIVIAIFLGFIFLGDSLHLGSLIGAVIIAIGFYAVIWGQAKEEEMIKEKSGILRHISSSSSSSSTPLLQNNNINV